MSMAPWDDDHNPTHFITDQTHDTISLPDLTSEQISDSDGDMFSDSSSSHHTMSTLQSKEVAGEFEFFC